MRALQPYQTQAGALKALDNGGRFFNLLARSGDAVIDPAELARAAGTLTPGREAWLYFEMALMDLPAGERAKVVARLAPPLAADYQAGRPLVLPPSRVEAEARAGQPVVIAGCPVYLEHRSQFNGLIVITVPVIMLVPLVDVFDVYEVYDTAGRSGERTVIAAARGSKRLDGVMARFGGLLKELTFEDKTGKGHGLYLDARYYTPLGQPV